MRQAIRTRVLPATNTKPTRVVAECDAKRITLTYDPGKSLEQNHIRVRDALVTFCGWSTPGRTWYTGTIGAEGYHVEVYTP